MVCISLRQSRFRYDSVLLLEMRVSMVILSVLLAFMRENEGQITTVSYFPKFPQVYVGDDLSLTCNGIGSIKWYINDALNSHQNSSMLLTALTPEKNGKYSCERNGQTDSYLLTVLELEPHAQLSLSAGGPVIAQGDGRNLVLQVDDDLKGWTCFASRFGGSGFKLGINIDKGTNRGFVFAELKDAYRASFWCMNRKTKHRSNAVTLKMTDKKVMLEASAEPVMQGEVVTIRCVVWGGGKVEQAEFYRNQIKIETVKDDTYTITNATQGNTGQYSCHATFRYSHISPQAALQQGDSDPQELRVIVGPLTTSVVQTSNNNLQCLCHRCYSSCTSYRWYHASSDNTNTHKTLPERGQNINAMDDGLYKCRADCGKGITRFSEAYNHKGRAPPGGPMVLILVMLILIVLGLLIIVLVVLKCRKRGGSGVRAVGEDKDKQPGGDYEQLKLTDQAVYHSLGDATGQDKAEGGYEALKKREEEAVYHTVVAGEGQGKAQGEGEGQGKAQGEGEGGYEALKSVKAEVYNTLGPTEGKSQGEGEGKQKTGDYEDVTVEDNPYEELKGEKQKKKAAKEAK